MWLRGDVVARRYGCNDGGGANVLPIQICMPTDGTALSLPKIAGPSMRLS
jgi:hypothetical protein